MSTNSTTKPGFLRRIGATIAGVFAGSMANLGLVLVGARIFPPPAGVDVNDVQSINDHMGDYSPLQLLSPFVAHAVGTLAGAWLASRLACRTRGPAFMVGLLFLVGGIMAVQMIPAAPLWFDALDLVVAYLPMAWLGAHLARPKS